MRFIRLSTILSMITLIIMLALTTTTHPARAHTQSASSTLTASWYGPGLYGNRTACGPVLTPQSRIVASRTLPCGTHLTICYQHRCARTTVEDRGPYITGRSMDIGPGTAHQLRFDGVHLVQVRRGW